MSKLSKRFHSAHSVKDDLKVVYGFDPTEPVKLELYGYRKSKEPYTFVTSESPDEIFMITERCISGDEVVTILYNDKSTEHHDASDCRLMDFDEGTWEYKTTEEIHSFIINHLFKS